MESLGACDEYLVSAEFVSLAQQNLNALRETTELLETARKSAEHWKEIAQAVAAEAHEAKAAVKYALECECGCLSSNGRVDWVAEVKSQAHS